MCHLTVLVLIMLLTNMIAKFIVLVCVVNGMNTQLQWNKKCNHHEIKNIVFHGIKLNIIIHQNNITKR